MTQKGWQDVARLSALVGDCTLEAADTMLERLSSLVDHNLLVQGFRVAGPDEEQVASTPLTVAPGEKRSRHRGPRA